jgi:hypothetical protein
MQDPAGRDLDAAHSEDMITEIIRPAAIVPQAAARAVLTGMANSSVFVDGYWLAEPSRWTRYDRPWVGPGDPGPAQRLGTIQVAYGTPTKYEITILQVGITRIGAEAGFSVRQLCDEALGFGETTLAECPRTSSSAAPKPIRF